MAQTPDQMAASMIANLEEKTGKKLEQWIAIVKGAELAKHGQIVKHLKSEHGMTHGYANLVAHKALQSDTWTADGDDLVSAQYADAKAELQPIYDALVKQVAAELYRELNKCGFRYAFVFLAHAGEMQEECFHEPAEAFAQHSPMRILIRAGAQVRPECDLGGGHAQANETAEALAADARAVHLDRYDPQATRLPKY